MTNLDAAAATSSTPWLAALRRYLAVVLLLNLIWEAAHLPLYTIGRDGTLREKAFAVFHCTLGDALIATATLVLGLIFAGTRHWPSRPHAFRRVAALTIAFALGYAIYSEWLNTSVRRSWAYSELMPVLPWLGTGLSPLLQWIVVPAIGFFIARRAAPSEAANGPIRDP